eukprot:scaffold37888_cov62-Attheya_sp.AAC.2
MPTTPTKRSTRRNGVPLFKPTSPDVSSKKRGMTELLPGGSGGYRTNVTKTDRNGWHLEKQAKKSTIVGGGDLNNGGVKISPPSLAIVSTQAPSKASNMSQETPSASKELRNANVTDRNTAENIPITNSTTITKPTDDGDNCIFHYPTFKEQVEGMGACKRCNSNLKVVTASGIATTIVIFCSSEDCKMGVEIQVLGWV